MGGFVKNITKAIFSPVKAIAQAAGLASSGGGGSSSSDVSAPAVASQVVTPKAESTSADAATTASDKKAIKRSGKKSLTVSRNAGSGVNI